MVTFTTLSYQRARTELFWFLPLHCGMGWRVESHPAGRDLQRANELIMSQRLACSWCCKASCFFSSHLAYVRGKGLKLSGRESEAHDTAQLSHMLIQFMCKSLRYHTHSSLKLCRKGRVKRPQGHSLQLEVVVRTH